MAYKRLGDLLISAGLITDEQLGQALALQKTSKKRLGDVLTESGIITEQQLIEALEMQLGVEFIDLSRTILPPEPAMQDRMAALVGALTRDVPAFLLVCLPQKSAAELAYATLSGV